MLIMPLNNLPVKQLLNLPKTYHVVEARIITALLVLVYLYCYFRFSNLQ